MRSWARELALGLLLATAIPQAPVCAAQSAEQILLDKANYWRLKDRPDLAIDALQQLLSINPSQPDALYQYGVIEVQRGNIDQAKGYLSRLQRAAPSSPRIADLENAIRAGQVSPNELSEARRLAQSGQFSQAAEKYQQTFRGPPPPTFGVEYYTTLAGTPQRWQEAKSGLESLVEKSPNDSKAKLALAEVLSYRAETRARGVRMLAQLSNDAVVGSQAARSWKQAVMWLGAGPEDRQLYSQYLAKFPQDAEVQAHLAEVGKPGAPGPGAASAAGYGDLNRGNLAAAERQFAADLRRRPGDPDALAGLGLVRLRQQRFGEARDLLGRAMRAAPRRRAQWATAYDSAVFWSGVNEAKAAIARGNYQRARQVLAGLGQGRSDSWNAEVLRGDVEARLGNYPAAEQSYRRVLAVRPDDLTALVGLYTALNAQGKTAEAAGMSARIAALGPGQQAGANRARADLLRTEGKNFESRGDAAGAAAKYQEAIAVDPNNPWARLDFARFLVRQGDAAQAFQIVDPAASGGTAESLHAAAIFYSEQNRIRDALALLERIPAGSRSAEVAAFRERILVTAEIDRAKQLARSGNRLAARNVLVSLYSRPPQTAAKTRLVADTLADIGDTQEALQLARAAAARGDARGTADYSRLLVRTGRDAEAAAYLMQAESSGAIGPDGRRELERVKIDIAVKRADALRNRGDVAGAYDQISALLAAYPNDPHLLLAAGRIYAAAGQNDIAMRFVDAAFRQAPGDLGVIRGAVGGAIVAGDLDRAQAYLAAGMQQFPNNPRLYYMAAEIDRASGNNGAAIYHLDVARRLDNRQAGVFEPLPSTAPAAAPGTPGALPSNPFRRPQAELLQQAPTMMLAAAASPIVATDATSAPPAALPTTPPAAPIAALFTAPGPLHETAESADSDDLVPPPRAGKRPPRRLPAGAKMAAAATPHPLPQAQTALLPSASDGNIAGWAEIGSGSGDDAERPRSAAATPRQLAQLAPLPPPVQGYQARPYGAPAYGASAYGTPGYAAPPYAAPAYAGSAGAPLQPLPPPPIQGYQPPYLGQPAPVPQDSLELDIERSMAAIAAESGPTLQGGFAFRARSGEDGLSRLTEIGVPIEGTFSPFYTGTVRLQAVPTYLTAGTADSNALLRFGQIPLLGLNPGATLASVPQPGGETAGGVALNVAYAYQMFSGEIGTTPLGFPVENLVGRLALMWPGPAGATTELPRIPLAPVAVSRPLQIKLEGARQPITESILSYAGTKDPVSGLIWGGVVKTGGNILVSYDDGDVGVYGGGGFWSIEGKSVKSNSEAEAIVGAYVRPYRAGETSLKIGLNLNYMGYDKNLRFFTFGHGGYFSPQHYINFSVPVEYSGRTGRFTYLAGGALGVQTFGEDRTPYFPRDPGKQAALQGTFGNAAFYPARDVTGLAFNAKGQLEYQLDNGFSIGGLATVDNAQNFTEGIAKLYLRKSFGAVPTAAFLPKPLPGSL